ncbi:alanine racemase [Mangrovicoccus algicola]|uniref:Alanine racemase n=1 Tax=Mangrovicoccus algicola TaxID=2771008 RepID=A0A8J6YZ81_9RHOB|nr:alanine racemase [Mangrovicoccus algicola]MBE3638736.1 alanine racemase [Mangrovicoccus algicola]
MATGHLDIDLDAVARNWQALNAMTATGTRTAATVKADGYGLGVAQVAGALARAGAREFFVAVAEEGAALRAALGPDVWIGVFSGHMPGDAEILRGNALVPMLNSAQQATRHMEALPGHPFGVQLDSGMNRLGMEPAEWQGLREDLLAAGPALLMSHLACADEPGHPANLSQKRVFEAMTDGAGVPRSLAATGGVLLGREYHYDLVRPGIGLYGGRPFEAAAPVVRLSLPVIQVRKVAPGEAVGYGWSWGAERPTRIATVAAGYADGILRALSGRAILWAGETACPLVGRVSMDLLTIDVSALDHDPEALDLLNAAHGVDEAADAAGTIGYEILTSLGGRYARRHHGG